MRDYALQVALAMRQDTAYEFLEKMGYAEGLSAQDDKEIAKRVLELLPSGFVLVNLKGWGDVLQQAAKSPYLV